MNLLPQECPSPLYHTSKNKGKPHFALGSSQTREETRATFLLEKNNWATVPSGSAADEDVGGGASGSSSPELKNPIMRILAGASCK